MRIRGVSHSARQENLAAWQAGLGRLSAYPNAVEFVQRFVELFEARLLTIEPRKRGTSQELRNSMGDEALARALREYPVGLAERKLALQLAQECWHYGSTLYQWAVSRGYMRPRTGVGAASELPPVMRYWGDRSNDRQQRHLMWTMWRQRTLRTNPGLVAFAERWVTLMEARVSRGLQVRSVALATLQEVGSARFSMEEITNVIRILSQCWYLGISLRNWAASHYPGIMD